MYQLTLVAEFLATTTTMIHAAIVVSVAPPTRIYVVCLFQQCYIHVEAADSPTLLLPSH